MAEHCCRMSSGLPTVNVLLVLVSLVTGCSSAHCNATAPRSDCGYVGIDESQCEAKGCCWSPKQGDPWCFYKSGGAICEVYGPRTDCGYLGITQTECEDKGCCWNPLEGGAWCYYKSEAVPSYKVTSVRNTTLGIRVTIESNGQTEYGPNISPLFVDISMETNERLHVKIYDPNNKRWEIPSNVSPIPTPPSSKPKSPVYKFTTAPVGSEFWFIVSRLSGEVIFNSTATSQYPGLEFADQFISISTTLPSNPYIYGLGEHVKPFRLPLNEIVTLWAADVPTANDSNLYGFHPIYYDMRTSGNAHGVYLRNSNGMDVVISKTSLSYYVIGGVLDFYFLLGPEPEAVAQQYQEVIGRPHMPPYWGLGFHNCRYGYKNVEVLQEVVANYSAAKIPLETMWSDIDYMDQYKDFTVDPVNYPDDKMKDFVAKLHAHRQHYVVITDPGIKNEKGYQPYDDGLQADIFLKDKNGNVFIGQVWPGTTAFPDFMNPKAFEYWETEITTFHDKLIPIDGLWIDMNEISNFCSGACSSTSKEKRRGFGFDPNNPPYQINNKLSRAPLDSKTTAMDCQHYGNVLEYNAHNLFGLLESKATCVALENLLKKRSFVISRSSFPGSGYYTGHWLGDNHARYFDLYASIPGILNFNMFGIPLIGADICGFQEDTTAELCSRWIEVGAFYSFSRVHSDVNSAPQELYRWDSVAAVARKVLAIRYSLLPYYYTLFYKAHRPVSEQNAPSATVLRPLFFEFPKDVTTFSVDRQFMVGSAVMISPVLTEGATQVTGYFPEGKWYDFYDHTLLTKTGKVSMKLPAPLDHIPIHLRGGSIVPMQAAANTTAVARTTNFSLLVALDSSGSAVGDLYVDDGESLTAKEWIFVEYHLANAKLTSKVFGPGYQCPPLDTVTVMGVSGQPTKASCNGKPVSHFMFNASSLVLQLSGLVATMGEPLIISWQ